MIVSNIFSAIFYIGTILLLPEQLVVSEMTAEFFGWIILIVVISWAPIFVL